MHKIAIRKAARATRAHTFRLIMRPEATLTLVAVLSGLAGTFIIEDLLASLLYNSRGNSVVLILATHLLVGLVAMLISLLKAARAASIDGGPEERVTVR
jgi:hypothetical protein